MKIKSTVWACCIASLLSSTHMMADSGLVLGINGGIGALATESESRNQLGFKIFEQEENINGGGFGVKVGYDSYFHEQQAIRTYVDYTYQQYKTQNLPTGDMDFTTYALNIEYRFDISPVLGVFIGPNLHYTQLNTKDSTYNQNSFGFGGNVGVVLAPLSFLEIEAKVRFINMPTNETNIPSTQIPPSEFAQGVRYKKFEIDAPTSFFIGVNLKF